MTAPKREPGVTCKNSTAPKRDCLFEAKNDGKPGVTCKKSTAPGRERFSEEQIALQLGIRDCVKKLKSGQKLAKVAQQASMPEQELMLLIEKTVGAI